MTIAALARLQGATPFKLSLSCLALLVLILMSSVGIAQEPGPIEAETQVAQDYEQIRKIVSVITEQFDPDEYYYVGVGRSPTPVIAYIQSVSSDQAINFPISNFKYHLSSPYSSDRLNPFYHPRLKGHFSDMLKPAIESGKKILFIDYANTGASLVAVKQYYDHLVGQERGQLSEALGLTKPDLVQEVQSTYQMRSEGQTVKLLTLASPSQGLKRFFSRNATSESATTTGTLAENLAKQRYDGYAEYRELTVYGLESFDPENHRTARYPSLLALIKAKQSTDISPEFRAIRFKLLSVQTCAQALSGF